MQEAGQKKVRSMAARADAGNADSHDAHPQKQTASLTKQIEADMAGRASGGGPLTIMKQLGDSVNAEKQKEKERKAAKAKAKGRA